MVEIKPFRGIRYNEEKVKDYRLVITPPYDVINEKELEEFYNSSEYNMVRLLLSKEQEGDDGENKYTRAAQYLKEWIDKGVLEKEDEECIYVYSQTFKCNGKLATRVGFISLIKIEELGKGVVPHEKILEKPLKDRLALLNATKANLGCVFLLYDDREKKIGGMVQDKIENEKTAVVFEDKVGVKHELWKISDSSFIGELKKEMEQYQCIIADGHHRYTSVLRYKEENKGIDSQYTMCCFVNSFNEGLYVLPIDRFVFNLENIDVDNVINELNKYFDIEEVKDVTSLVSKVDNTQIMIDKAVNLKNHVFGMYCYLNKKSYFLKLKDNKILDKHYGEKSDVYRKLDINILHKIVFEEVFGISKEDQSKGTHIEYTKGPKRALEKISDSKYQFAFFINAPLMREIFLTARAHETMPQKSTYFYPKIYSGLVINKLEK